MTILVKTIGILICCLAAILLFSPATMRKAIAFAKEGRRLLYAAVARTLIGALLIVAAFSCRFLEVVLTIGILLALTGGIPIALGMPRMQAFVDWWLGKSDGVLRTMAVVALLIGTALVYAA